MGTFCTKPAARRAYRLDSYRPTAKTAAHSLLLWREHVHAPYLYSACEDGYVLAVYKNWKDPPLSSQWFEDAEGCFIPRTYCFSCSDGNCAPRHCEVCCRSLQDCVATTMGIHFIPV